MQAVIERRHNDHERFEENRLFEEKTDIAERLGYPIDITIDYAVRDGAVYALTDTVERPFHNQTFQAKLAGASNFTGDQAFEQTRLAHEHDEALLVDRLAAGELEGNVLIKFSKVPDAVVEGRTSIKGYRRDLLRSFVRLYYKTDTGVSCRLFTLDHNNQVGIKRVGDMLSIDATRASEVVLGDHALVEVPEPSRFVDELAERVKSEYEYAIFEQASTLTVAGSVYADRMDAMKAIEQQPHLVAQHMDAIVRLVGDAREKQREKTAAAIKLASEGHIVNSSSDASVGIEVTSGNYGGECATASQTGMNQAGKNSENVWTYGECRVCFVRTSVGSCHVCQACATADDRGVDLLKLRERNIRRREKVQRLTQKTLDHTYTKKNDGRVVGKKSDSIKAKYGEHAVVTKQIAIGGTKEVVLDPRTKYVLAA